MLGSSLSNWLHFFFLGNNKSRMPRLGGKGEVGLKDWFCVDLYRPRECVWRSKTRTSTQKRVFLRNAKVEQVENHHTHAHTHGKIELSFSHFFLGKNSTDGGWSSFAAKVQWHNYTVAAAAAVAVATQKKLEKVALDGAETFSPLGFLSTDMVSSELAKFQYGQWIN